MFSVSYKVEVLSDSLVQASRLGSYDLKWLMSDTARIHETISITSRIVGRNLLMSFETLNSTILRLVFTPHAAHSQLNIDSLHLSENRGPFLPSFTSPSNLIDAGLPSATSSFHAPQPAPTCTQYLGLRARNLGVLPRR